MDCLKAKQSISQRLFPFCATSHISSDLPERVWEHRFDEGVAQEIRVTTNSWKEQDDNHESIQDEEYPWP
jgi:hypothetical protein